MRRHAKQPLLTAREEVALSRLIHGDDPEAALKARNELVERNLGLVGMAAGWYVRNMRHVDHDELMSEGMVALISAAELYTPWTSKARFSTYAGRAIFNNLREWMCLDRTVHVPKYLQDPNQVRLKLAHVHERTPARRAILERNLACAGPPEPVRPRSRRAAMTTSNR